MKSFLTSSALIGLATILGGFSTPADAAIVESFDSGSWGAGWSAPTAGVVNSSAAHDGPFGVTLGAAQWTVNSSILVGPGSKLSAWVRPALGSSGRVYLGFGADASGTHSFVGATNTDEILFQDNPNFNFTDLNRTNETWVDEKWYLVGPAKSILTRSRDLV